MCFFLHLLYTLILYYVFLLVVIYKKNMRNIQYVAFILLICISVNLDAQENKQNMKPEKRFFAGGSFGLQLGTITLIDVSPLLGYRFNNNLAAGIGASYQYFRDKTYNPVFKTDIYSGRVFLRYYITAEWLPENIFLHTEFEYLNREAYVIKGFNYYEYERIFVPIYYIGAGYQQPISRNSFITLVGLWDIIEDQYSPYSNPVLRVGINLGF